MGWGWAQPPSYIHVIKLNDMKAKYTPGTPDGLVGKTHSVEVIGIKMGKVKFNSIPHVMEVQIKYADGKTEWVDGMKFYDDTNNTKMIQHITY